MGVLLVDAGLVALLVGCVSLIRPLRFLRIRTRRGAAAVMVAGLALVVAGAALPAPLRRSTAARTRIDDFAAAYQFNERHSIRVQAPPDRVFLAIKTVTADEIRFFRILTWIRSPHLPGRGPESILNVPAAMPILDVALRGGFVLLAEEPDHELVVGAVVCCRPRARVASAQEFQRLDHPGVAKAVMNFLVEDEGGGWTRVTTETRVFATDPSATRRFAAYWRVIYPGSALIRRMWLGAIQRRAELAQVAERAEPLAGLGVELWDLSTNPRDDPHGDPRNAGPGRREDAVDVFDVGELEGHRLGQ